MIEAIKKSFTEAGIAIDGDRPWDIKVIDKRLWRRLALHGSMGFGEAYMDGWWECEAIDEMVHRLMALDRDLNRERLWYRLGGTLVFHLLNLQRLSRAFQVGKAHYDIGNELYRRMLGEDMVYSCAFWEEGAETLEEAQRDKMELVCRKLCLEPGMTILDIGCGWGSFCKYAAETHGAKVVGLTISKEQAEKARDLCSGLPVEIKLQDYRTFSGRFDRIVSIGMFEHVGPKNYATFMEQARSCLEPEGLFLLHTIGSNISYTNSRSWITRYIFPNGHIPSLAQVGTSTERRFVVEDLHNFGVNYDYTLMSWEANFRKSWDDIKGQSSRYNDRFYRMWRFYLLSCAGAFRARHLQLWQFVLSPRGLTGGYRRPEKKMEQA
ncbi:MAG: cyclopropane fatty acyl phospholipid synthase [Oceanipulchritudo sp.]